MGTVTIRNLDDGVKQRLRLRAARHGRSMEAEARAILGQAVNAPSDSEQTSEPRPVRGRWKGRLSTDAVMRITRDR